MTGFIHTAFGFVAGLGLTAAAAGTVPVPVAAVAVGLENAAYTDVLVTERIFGGFAIEGTKGADFAIIIVDAQGKMLDHAELFRDADGDGVFEANETLGLPGRNTLRDLIFEALATPADQTEREVNFGTLDTAGFGQNIKSLFAIGGLRLNAGQRLGSGSIALLDESLSLDVDREGLQRRGDSQTQLQTMTGFGILKLSAAATNGGGAGGAFAPLMISLPGAVTSGVNAEDIRSSVTSNILDAKALENSIMALAPSAVALTEQIMINAPTVESIRAIITSSMTPTAP
jgi:hypothetical protein